MARNLNDLKRERIVKRYSYYFNTKLDYICNKYLEDGEDEDDCVVDLSSMDFTESSKGSVHDHGAHIDRLKRYKAAGRDYKEGVTYSQPQREVEYEDDDWQSGEEDESVLQDLKRYMEQEPSDGETLSTTSSPSHSDMIITYKDIIEDESTSSSDEDYLDEERYSVEDQPIDIEEAEHTGREAKQIQHSPSNETYVIPDHSRESENHLKTNRGFFKDQEQKEPSSRPGVKLLHRGRSNIKRDFVNYIDKMKPCRKGMFDEDSEPEDIDRNTSTMKHNVNYRHSPPDNKTMPMHQTSEFETDYMRQRNQRPSRVRTSDDFEDNYRHTPPENQMTPNHQNRDSEINYIAQRQSRMRTRDKFDAKYGYSPQNNQMKPDQNHSQQDQSRYKGHHGSRKEPEYNVPITDDQSSPFPKHQNRDIETDHIVHPEQRHRLRTRDILEASPGLKYKDIPQSQIHFNNSSQGPVEQIQREATLKNAREVTLKNTREATLQNTRKVDIQTDEEQDDNGHKLQPTSPYEKYYRLGQNLTREGSNAQNNPDSLLNLRFDNDNHNLYKGDDLSPSVRRRPRRTDNVMPQKTTPQNTCLSSVDGKKVLSAYALHRHLEPSYKQQFISQSGGKKSKLQEETLELRSPLLHRDKRRGDDERNDLVSPVKENRLHDSMLEKSSKKDSGINSFIEDTHSTEADCRRLSVKNLKAFNDSLTGNIDIDVSMNQSDLIRVVENENASKVTKWLKTFPEVQKDEEDIIIVDDGMDNEESSPAKTQSARTTPRGKSRSRHTSGPTEKANVSCQTDPRSPRNNLSPQQTQYSKAIEHYPAQPKSSKRVFIKVARSEKKDKHKRRLSRDIGEMMRNVYSSPQRRMLIEKGLKSSGSSGKIKKRLVNEMEEEDETCDGYNASDSVPTPPKSRKTSIESRLPSDLIDSVLSRSDMRNSQNSHRFDNSVNDRSRQNASIEQFYNDTVNYINSKTSPSKREAYNRSLNVDLSMTPQQILENSPRQRKRNNQQMKYVEQDSYDYNLTSSSRSSNKIDTHQANRYIPVDSNRFKDKPHNSHDVPTAHVYEQLEQPDYYESNEQLSDFPVEYRMITNEDSNQIHPYVSQDYEIRNRQYCRQSPHVGLDNEMKERHFRLRQSCRDSVERTVSNDVSQYEADLESNCETTRPEQSTLQRYQFENVVNSRNRHEIQNQRHLINNTREEQVVDQSHGLSNRGVKDSRLQNRSIDINTFNSNNSVQFRNTDMARYARNSKSFDMTNNQSQNNTTHRRHGDNRNRSSDNEIGHQYQNFSPRHQNFANEQSDDHVKSPNFQNRSNTKGRFDPFSPSGSMAKLHLKTSRSQRNQNPVLTRENLRQHYDDRHTTQDVVDDNDITDLVHRRRSGPSNRKERSYNTSYDADNSTQQIQDHICSENVTQNRSFNNLNSENKSSSQKIQCHSRNIPENSSYDNLDNENNTSIRQMRRQNSGYSLRDRSLNRIDESMNFDLRNSHQMNTSSSGYYTKESVYENISDKENDYRDRQRHEECGKDPIKSRTFKNRVYDEGGKLDVYDRNMSSGSGERLYTELSPSKTSVDQYKKVASANEFHWHLQPFSTEPMSCDFEDSYKSSKVTQDRNTTKSGSYTPKSGRNSLQSSRNTPQSSRNISQSGSDIQQSSRNTPQSDRNIKQSEQNTTKSGRTPQSGKITQQSDINIRQSGRNTPQLGRNTPQSGRDRVSPRYKEPDLELTGHELPVLRNVRQSPRRSQSQSFDSAFDGRHSQSSYDLLDSRASSHGNNNENSFVRAKRAENNESNVAHIRKMEVSAKCSPKPKMKKSLFTGNRNVETPVSFTDFAQGVSNSGTCEKAVSAKNSRNSPANFKMPFSVSGLQNSAAKTLSKLALPKRPFQPQASYKDATLSSEICARGRASAGYRGRGQNVVHSTPMRSKSSFLLNETLSTIQAPDETENEDDVILLHH